MAVVTIGATTLVASAVARTWPDRGLSDGREQVPGGEAVLASAPPHGMPVHWFGSGEQLEG